MDQQQFSTLNPQELNQTKQPLAVLKNIRKLFFTDELETHALSDINININRGEYLSISGPSGGGKSTLLGLLGLLDNATDGVYQLAGKQVSSLDREQRAKIRNEEIGFIFQAFNLISDLTVFENVELPLTYRKNLSKTQRKQMVTDALEKVDMIHRAKHFPSQLSGGQQQRVAVARAISGNPSIILADEPTGNLDSNNASRVLDMLDELHRSGATICMVTHDPISAARAERVIEIFDGKIVSDNPVEKNSITV